MDKATCVGCGCDDDHACAEGCFWLRVDYQIGQGVCSECPSHVVDWDRGHAMLPEREVVDHHSPRHPLTYNIPADILRSAQDPVTKRIDSARLEACWSGHGELLTVLGPSRQVYILSFVRSFTRMLFGWAHENKDCLLDEVTSIAGEPEEEVVRLAQMLGCERTALVVAHKAQTEIGDDG